MVSAKLMPPDTGYAWVIASAFSLHHLIVIPLGHCFGLIFKDKFRELGFSATDITLIVNSNTACTFWCGIINGALLKHFGYRKVAFVGAGLMTTGIFMTAYAQTFMQYFICYGFITAIGMGMGVSSYPFALNCYFKKNRSKAYGYAMTVSGLGPVLLPQLISILLPVYGETGTVVILAGIACHAFVSASLLQPIKRHMKQESLDDNVTKEATDGLLANENKKIIDSHCVEIEKGTDSVLSTNEYSKEEFSVKTTNEDLPLKNDTEQIKGSLDIKETNTNKNTKTILNKITLHIINIFDLTLLKDATFINIIAGISLGVFAEKNFSSLTPFIMQDYGLNTQQTATFMSTLSITDICFRFVAPYVGDFFKKPVRVMYTWSLVLLVIFRCGLLLTDNYPTLLICAVLIGLARGFRTIYWMLVVPSYVPIERLASASGLQSVLNGLLIWMGAPFLGFLKDLTGSFKTCVLIVNVMTFLSIVMWVTEFVYKRYKRKMVPEFLTR